MKTLLSFLMGFALAAILAGTAVYRAGGDLQFKMRMAQDIASRPPNEAGQSNGIPDPTPDAALMSGQAWRDFCALLEKAGEQILREDVPGDPRTRAEGFEFLSGLLLSGLNMYMFADPDRPHFVRPLDWEAKWGLDNSDALYLSAAIDGSKTYRIRGTRGTVRFLGIQASFGRFGSSQPMGVASSLTGDDLSIADDGSFEIIASAAPQPGNWLRLTPETNSIGVRMFFSDWENEEPGQLYIERVDGPEGPRIVNTHSVARRLGEVAGFVEGSAKLWTEFTLGRRPTKLNTLTAPAAAGDMQGSNAQRYGSGHFALREGEALLIEFEPPEALYWNFELGDFWKRSLDFANRPISINDHQAVADPDGIVRLIVSSRDPGLANWLDTTGAPEGPVTYRWNGAKTHPHPRARVVRLEDLDREVPANAVRVSPTQRAERIEARRRAVQRRFQRG
jgi:hypothetical protein